MGKRKPFLMDLESLPQLRIKFGQEAIHENVSFEDGFKFLELELNGRLVLGSFYFYWIKENGNYLFYREEQIEPDINYNAE